MTDRGASDAVPAKGLTRVFSFRIGLQEWGRLVKACEGLRRSPKDVLLEALGAFLQEKLKRYLVTTEIRTPKGTLKVSRWSGPGEVSISVGGSLLARFSGHAKGKRITDRAVESAVAVLAEALSEQADE